MKYRLLYILLLFSFCAFSQNVERETIHIKKAVIKTLKHKDSIKETDEVLHSKKFEKEFQDNYQTSDFDYSLTKPKESLWQKIKRKIGEFLSEIFEDVEVNKINASLGQVLNIIAFLVIVSGLFFLLRFLFGKDGNWFFSKKNKKINPKSRIIDENIHELDFSKLITNFEQQQDFRSAIRYQFLHLLKHLTDSGRIEWNPEKTNKDYLKELKKDNLYEDFKSLVYIFDNVWYGEFLVSEEMYKNAKQQFEKAKQSVK